MEGGQWRPSAMRRSLDVCVIARRVSRDLRRFPDVCVIVCRVSRVCVVRFWVRCPLLGVCPCLGLCRLVNVSVSQRSRASSSPPRRRPLSFWMDAAHLPRVSFSAAQRCSTIWRQLSVADASHSATCFRAFAAPGVQPVSPTEHHGRHRQHAARQPRRCRIHSDGSRAANLFLAANASPASSPRAARCAFSPLCTARHSSVFGGVCQGVHSQPARCSSSGTCCQPLSCLMHRLVRPHRLSRCARVPA